MTAEEAKAMETDHTGNIHRHAGTVLISKTFYMPKLIHSPQKPYTEWGWLPPPFYR